MGEMNHGGVASEQHTYFDNYESGHNQLIVLGLMLSIMECCI